MIVLAFAPQQYVINVDLLASSFNLYGKLFLNLHLRVQGESGTLTLLTNFVYFQLFNVG